MRLGSGDELHEAADARGETQSPGKTNDRSIWSFREARVEFLVIMKWYQAADLATMVIFQNSSQ